MKEIEINGAKHLITSVPKYWGEEELDYECQAYYVHYTKIFRYSTATESDFEKVIPPEFDGEFPDYYLGVGHSVMGAKLSFLTLLISLSLDPKADYIILKRK